MNRIYAIAIILAFQVIAQDTPNIVWIMAEDIGPDIACYGHKGLQTPNIDRIAAEGIKLTRAYTNNPICSPARSSMITGMHQNVIGAHNHRSHRGDGYNLPEPVTTMTHLLRQAGYYTSNGNGYGAKTDLNFNLTDAQKPLFDGNNWSGRSNGQPFFAQIQLKVTHRNNAITGWQNNRANSSDPVNPADIELPPYLPDVPEVREDWALYLDQMEVADREVGEILQRLENENILDNTMVIFIGDNGRCQVRGKGYVYEDGVLVPAVIRWPGKIVPGTVSDELVPMIDMVAQILVAAGVEVPAYMNGRPFLENSAEDREYVFVARDRWDEIMDKCRAVIGKRFKLVRNDMAMVPWDAGQRYLENSGVRPLLPTLRTMYTNGEMDSIQAQFFQPVKPSLQLFDLENDPWETVNLANDPAHKVLLDSLMEKLRQWETEAGDMGRIPEPPSALTGNFSGWFDNNEHMQNIIQQHKVTINQTGQGTVTISYAGLQELGPNSNARYGFELWVDAEPTDGQYFGNITSDDVEGVLDRENNRLRFFMPLEDVAINVEFTDEPVISTWSHTLGTERMSLAPAGSFCKYRLLINSAYTGRIDFKLVNSGGKQVFTGTQDKTDAAFTHIYDLENLPSGVYKAIVIMGENSHHYPVIIQQ